MKRFLISVLFVGLFVGGCSSDDDNTSNDTDSANIYLPLTTGNFWDYDVVSSAGTSQDHLYVGDDEVVNGQTYKQMMTSTVANGFYSGSMNGNSVRKVNSSIVMTGNAVVNFPGVTPISLPLNDFVIFRENANDGEQLSIVSGNSVQDLQGYPVDLVYSLKSEAGETLASYTVPGGETYTDVKVVVVKMNLRAYASLLGVPVDILNSQDVLVSNQYYAKNIGMVYAQNTFSYTLQDISMLPISLPIPESMTEVSTETLTTYEVE